MSISWLVLALAYLFLLFWIAKWGDKNTPTARWLTSHPMVYCLALGIYCTAWTFFGAVGQSSQQGWMFLPILLGPMIVYVVFNQFIYKLIFVSKKQHISTIADFISSRYGKRQIVALVVTMIALMATIPYIALQLKAIGSTFSAVTDQQNSQTIVILASIFIAGFAMYFGTRNTDVTEYRRGLMLAISFESVIKLIALILVAFIGYHLLLEQEAPQLLSAYVSEDNLAAFSSFTFWAQTLMAGAAVICLPRQFHIMVIDNLHLSHVKVARIVFPLYLLAISLTIPIIAAVGNRIFASQGVEGDAYVISIALLSDSVLVKTFVYLGGLSAATAMIIVATLALSTMLTNDLVLPKIMSADPSKMINRVHRIKRIRRVVIFLILLLAFIYQQQMTNDAPLASIGLLAFSLVIQLLPAIVGGLYWERGHAHGVYAGLSAGFVCWVMFLLLPLLEPQSVGYQTETLSKGAILSLVVNTIAYITFSYFAKPRFIDRIQAKIFVRPFMPTAMPNNSIFEVKVEDLKTLILRFAGEQRTTQVFDDYQSENQLILHNDDRVSERLLQYCETVLGGVVGSSSAKVLIDSLVKGKKLDITDVVNFFDDTTQAMQFNMSALLTSLENIDQGISVIDKNLNLVAWNKRYLDLFNYPKDLIKVGTPIESIIRHNVLRGNCGPGEVEFEVQKRIDHLRNATPHRFVRQRDDGRVIEMVGNPLPEGGFVTSFHDITGHVEIQQALKESNINLEARVAKRTEEVHSINAELRLEIERRTKLEQSLIRARQEAESANESKTRFLAFASHDVLQPLNAAKLYLTVLEESELQDEQKSIVKKLADSVVSSETLISTILDITRLDQGELKPFNESINVKEIITPVINELTLKAKEKGLEFVSEIEELWVYADKTYLYRIVQNLVSNAVKYTREGSVKIKVFAHAGKVQISIIDTGIGIPKLQQAAIFSDFYRVANTNENGVGLGLGVVKRLSQQLNCQIKVDSIEGEGSTFSIFFDEVEALARPKLVNSALKPSFAKLKILCVDDQQENLDAIKTVLEKWDCIVETAQACTEALAIAQTFSPQILFVDYQLGPGPDGLAIIEQLRQQQDSILPACLVTAKRGDELLKLCSEQGVNYMSKPIKPAKMRSLLQSMRKFIQVKA